MASNFEEEPVNSSTNQDLRNPNNTEINNKKYKVEIDANPDNECKDPLLSCFRGGKSSDSELEENTTNKKIDKQALNKTEDSRQQIYNTRALTNLARTYMLERFNMNLLLIFNQYNIQGYKPRRGTVEDAEYLVSTFVQYGFHPRIYEDYTRKEILDELDSLANTNFTDYGCIVVVVMTHGTYGGEIMASDISYNERDILERLKSRKIPTLVTKPIILLIQACRGYNDIEGVPVNKASCISKDNLGEKIDYYLPLEADTLVFHSSYIGAPSHRPINGTWFIQTLCKKINEMSDDNDLESIMIEVKREVACDLENVVEKKRTLPKGQAREAQKNVTTQPGSSITYKEHHKQMPTVTSALTRKLYLIRKPVNNTSTQTQAGVSPINSNDTVDNIAAKRNTTTRSYDAKPQSDPCLCYLDHLDYMRKCLSHYVAINNKDDHAQFLLDSLPPREDPNPELTKSKLENLSHYLRTRQRLSDYHKYMYFYGSVRSATDDNGQSVNNFNNDTLPATASKWGEIKKYMCLK